MRYLALIASTAGLLILGTAPGRSADLPMKAVAPMPVMTAFSWTGFYIGANVGGGWNNSNRTSDGGPLFPPFAVLPPITPVFTVIPGQLATLAGTGTRSGVIGGGQAGYNWQVNQFVFGLEGDVVGTDLRGSSGTATRSFGPPILPVTVTQTVTAEFGRLDWMASIRGRIGFAADRVLFYATGGAAVAEFGGATTTVVNGPGIGLPAGTFVATTGGSTTRWGWTVGGGIEWAFTNNWSLAGEYRHTDFGNRATTFDIPSGLAAGPIFATGTSSGRFALDQATARLNYRFGGPVVARY